MRDHDVDRACFALRIDIVRATWITESVITLTDTVKC